MTSTQTGTQNGTQTGTPVRSRSRWALDRAHPWFVTDRHGVAGPDGARTPFERRHARRVDTRLTACGISTVGWELFWDLPFDPRHPDVCRDCSAEVTARPGW